VLACPAGDRPAGLERHGKSRHVGRLILTPGPDGALAVEIGIGPPTAEEERETVRPTVLMERVSRWAALQPAPWSKKTAEEEVTGQTQYIRIAVDVLLAEGYLDGGEKGFRYLRDYRREDDPEDVPDQSREGDDDPLGSSGGSSSPERRRGGPKSAGGSSPRRPASEAGSRHSGGGSSSASSQIDWRDELPDGPTCSRCGGPRESSGATCEECVEGLDL
jgi:hypothetical protein